MNRSNIIYKKIVLISAVLNISFGAVYADDWESGTDSNWGTESAGSSANSGTANTSAASSDWDAAPGSVHQNDSATPPALSTDYPAINATVSSPATETSPAYSTSAAQSVSAVDESEVDYTIKKGDCLWNLAFQFLGNPFQWPRIWQINPYIKDPDLIYPGDRLKIPGRNSTAYSSTSSSLTGSGGSQSSALLQSKTGNLLSNATQQQASMNSALDQLNDSIYLTIIRSKQRLGGNFFSSVPFLWVEKNAAGEVFPGSSTVDKPEDRAMYQLFDRISITVKKDEAFKIGDTVDLFTSFRYVSFDSERANIIKRTGVASVIEVKGNKVFAKVFKVFDRVLGGEHVTKATFSKFKEIDTIVTPEIAIQGSVFTRAEETESPYVFQTLLIDKGSQDGVETGDIFAVYHTKKNELSTQVAAIGYVANVQKSSSSLVILKMADNKVDSGDKVTLIRRTVFSSGGGN